MKHLNKILFSLLILASFCCVINTGYAADNTSMEDKKTAILRGLDKITGKVLSFSVPVGNSKSFGTLYIQVSACKKALPFEKPEASAFLKIWDAKLNEQPVEVFSGWMFASSPALSAMDHAIYDIWVYDCTD